MLRLISADLASVMTGGLEIEMEVTSESLHKNVPIETIVITKKKKNYWEIHMKKPLGTYEGHSKGKFTEIRKNQWKQFG